MVFVQVMSGFVGPVPHLVAEERISVLLFLRSPLVETFRVKGLPDPSVRSFGFTMESKEMLIH